VARLPLSVTIEPDWLLVYRDHGHEIELVRTGTHLDLFG
jgi:mRNA-degrading endonuclease YafQ of YafQ-DinJ toxin-antitoxin module